MLYLIKAILCQGYVQCRCVCVCVCVCVQSRIATTGYRISVSDHKVARR